ncbi:MAG TPA: hypothetical protein VKM55_18760 [Candidatus Lokiarchaeia archaeon]|nr:hypothetical protein [Candidatus Lokiarchaeia archaeon]
MPGAGAICGIGCLAMVVVFMIPMLIHPNSWVEAAQEIGTAMVIDLVILGACLAILYVLKQRQQIY